MNLPGTTRRPLEGQHFQVVVIGGGINGVAIARECARAGRRTLLVEQHDFAAGTTSRSTRMIHGGLRYLEHGEIGLVRESLRERQRLLRERPHLVHPVNFLLALDSKSRRSALSIRTGLWLYRRLGGKLLGADAAKTEEYKLERVLDSGRPWSLFSFEDAQCEFPERLVAEWLMEAVAAGAVARNHTQVLAVDVFHGRAKGALLRDQLSGKEDRVEANWIINATGPWVDRICQRSRINTRQPMVGGVRGSHLVLPRFAGAPEAAVYTEATDGRPIFVIPWNDQILVGTTEIPDHGDPAKTAPSKEEMEYLLRSLLHLFPRARVSLHDIRYAFAGVRPLPFSPKTRPSEVSRKHYLHDHSSEGAAHMISVVGGKLTTAAELARQCAAKLGLRPQRRASLTMAAEENLDALLDGLVSEIADAGGIGAGSAQAIVEWHGGRSLTIARTAAPSAKMRAPLCPHSQHIVAEAVDAFTHQSAVTLADVLLRRVPVALGGCWSEACSREAAMRVGTVMGWNEHQAAVELEALETERTAFLRKPARVDLMLEAAAD
ncbi:MAG TPA: glycerol-3-phosphate dehydrogenase/oxidase [Terriglobales bacterium]|jgi:glycerol-3-phosphate dehydrogenase|nr:glycerol-3-phosphate dehydrogenase/oxidase [Terriglobales bacterium]